MISSSCRAASGGFIALFAVPLLGMGDIRELGTRMGLFLSVISIGALAGPPISGAINEATGGFVLVGVYAGKCRDVNSHKCYLLVNNSLQVLSF